ncbi:YbgA family protein [Clostridium algidicarnis]|uniref:YbgA family protein n=1 Tax=Clostridium algidicarnis TaxID=37659 RepID=UPI000495F56A|nr:DUF523 and DUF1722 domain-containing protein [Clostridium algidicarnis]
MDEINKPKVVVSRCLGFSACRYNGDTVSNKFVSNLKDYVEYNTVCPEVGIGLGVPRDSVRLVSKEYKITLYQPKTGNTYTKEMEDYSLEFLDSLKDVDGFILKGRSPTCGIKDVKIYLGKEKSSGSTKGAGIFAREVIKRYPYLAIEEEGRLTNFRIREHFLTKLYIMFKFRQVKEIKSMANLVKFQSDNKYLLMAYNQKEQKVLGRIVANHDKKSFDEIIEEYREHLGYSFRTLPRYTNYINTLMHIFGYFSDNLSSNEKVFILGTFDKYKDSKVPLSVPMNLLRSYVIKYEQSYLLDQTIWQPYPEELVDISDTGKIDNL